MIHDLIRGYGLGNGNNLYWKKNTARLIRLSCWLGTLVISNNLVRTKNVIWFSNKIRPRFKLLNIQPNWRIGSRTSLRSVELYLRNSSMMKHPSRSNIYTNSSVVRLMGYALRLRALPSNSLMALMYVSTLVSVFL